MIAGGLLGLALLLGPMTALAEDPAPPSAAHDYFTDVELVNQYGETMRLYSDLMKGRTVVVTAFFSSCEASCPVTNSRLQHIAKVYESRLDKDLVILSISLVPETDTPGKLKAHAESLSAPRGWYLLTGSEESVHLAQVKFGQYVENEDAHDPVLKIGNDRTGLWKKAMGMGDAEDLARIVGTVLDDPGPSEDDP